MASDRLDDEEISHEAIIALINAVKSQRTVWDLSDHGHYFKNRVRESWEIISIKTGLETDVAKTQWKKLRDRYKRDAYKYKLHNRKSTFRYYPNLTFLNIGKHKIVKGQTVKKPSTPPAMKAQSPKTIKPSNGSQEPKGDGSATVDSLIDGDYLFLVSLLPTIKKLGEESRMHLKMKIQNIVYEELASVKNCNSNDHHS